MDDEEMPHPDMTPMIDVVFQLLIFFLVSMKFKTLDMKIEAFLPTDKGLAKTIANPEEKPKVEVVLKRKRIGAGTLEPSTRVKVQNQLIGKSDDTNTWSIVESRAADTIKAFKSAGGEPSDVKGEVDAAPLVPTGDVVRAVDALIAGGIQDVTFVGTPEPGSALHKVFMDAQKAAGVR